LLISQEVSKNRQTMSRLEVIPMHLFLVILTPDFEETQVEAMVGENEEAIMQQIIKPIMENDNMDEKEAREYLEDTCTITIEQIDKVEEYTVKLIKE